MSSLQEIAQIANGAVQVCQAFAAYLAATDIDNWPEELITALETADLIECVEVAHKPHSKPYVRDVWDVSALKRALDNVIVGSAEYIDGGTRRPNGYRGDDL